MRKKVCLLLAFLFSLLSTPATRLLFSLGEIFGADVDLFPKQSNFSDIIKSQPGGIGVMLCLISVCGFFYADVENGYVKNIAGQMPRKGLPCAMAVRKASAWPLSFMNAMASANAPTPGITTPSADSMSAGLSEINADAPASSSPRSTLERLPLW